MAYNLQDDSDAYPELDVLVRSRDEWLDYTDVDDVFRLHVDPTFSLDPVEPYQEGLYLYSVMTDLDANMWEPHADGTIERKKKTLENPPLFYSKCFLVLHPMDEAMFTTYERRIYRHTASAFAGSRLVHYRVRSTTNDAPEDDTGEDTETSEPSDTDDSDDDGGDIPIAEEDNSDGLDNDGAGDDHPNDDAPSPPKSNAHMALVDIDVQVMTTDILRSIQYNGPETMLEVGKLGEESDALAMQCLFAPETFSIGLNMPAKTIVLTNVRKLDRDEFRWISSGEYIQMGGRAERLGIDKRSICILMVDEKLEPAVAKSILKGADSSIRAFHLIYNMFLSQLRCEDGDPENLLRYSYRAIPDLEKQINALEGERNYVEIEEEERLQNYFNLSLEYKSLDKDMRESVFTAKYCLSFLPPNRAVCLDCKNDEGEPQSFSINGVKSLSEDNDNRRPKDANYAVNVLTRCLVSRDSAGKMKIKHLPFRERGERAVVSVPLSQIQSLSSAMMNISKAYLQLEARENVLKKVFELLSRHPVGIPLDPEVDTKIRSRSSTALAFKDELTARNRGLRRLGYVTSDNVVDLNGEVACKISSAEELTLTEPVVPSRMQRWRSWFLSSLSDRI